MAVLHHCLPSRAISASFATIAIAVRFLGLSLNRGLELQCWRLTRLSFRHSRYDTRIKHEITRPEERVLAVDCSCARGVPDARLIGNVERRLANQLHGALPGLCGGRERQLLNELTDQLAAALPARPPAAQHNRSCSSGHHRAGRQE